MKSDYQNTKKQNKNRATKSSVILIVLFTFIIIASSFVIANFDSLVGEPIDGQTSASNVVEHAAYQDDGKELYISSASNGKSTGFPVSFASNSIVDAEIVDSRIFVLNKDMLTCLSSSGTVKYTKVLNFVDPIMKISGKYCLVFDRGNNKYMIFNKNELVRSGTSENDAQIITGEIADDGSCVISSRKSGATSMLTYYNKSGDKLFQWVCANEHIVSLAISDNRKSLACAAINSQEGDVYTKVYYFDINSSDNNKNYKIKSTAAMDLFFISNTSVISVCNNQRILFNCKNKDEKPVSLSFASSVLLRANDDYGNTAVISKKIDSFDKSELSVYDSKNNLAYSCDIDNDVTDIICNKGHVYILGGDNISIYSSSGKLSETIEVENSSIGIVFGSGRLYRYSQGCFLGAV